MIFQDTVTAFVYYSPNGEESPINMRLEQGRWLANMAPHVFNAGAEMIGGDSLLMQSFIDQSMRRPIVITYNMDCRMTEIRWRIHESEEWSDNLISSESTSSGSCQFIAGDSVESVDIYAVDSEGYCYNYTFPNGPSGCQLPISPIYLEIWNSLSTSLVAVSSRECGDRWAEYVTVSIQPGDFIHLKVQSDMDYDFRFIDSESDFYTLTIIPGNLIDPLQITASDRDPNPALGWTFATIPSGSFSMGSPSSELHRNSDEEPVHTVSVQAFELMTTEVTQEMWEEVMGSNPASGDGVGSSYPVYNVSWDDCQQFINQLNSLDTEYEYRLPSEAEWEYACRAGTTTAYYWGNSMNGSYCWYTDNSSSTNPVAQKLPNAWGLYDMSGNVNEWCQDVYHDSYQDRYSGAPTDGRAWLFMSGNNRSHVYRGGGWHFFPLGCRSAFRGRWSADIRFFDLGLRLVRLPR